MIITSKSLSGYSLTGTLLQSDIPYIEVQWNRKMYEAGNFSVYLRLQDYNPNIAFYKLDGRPEWGMVQKYDYQDKPEGEFVTLSGFFAEFCLKWGTAMAQESWEYPSSWAQSYGTLAHLFRAFNWDGGVFSGMSLGNGFNSISAVYQRGETYYDLVYKSLAKHAGGANVGTSIRATPVFENSHWKKMRFDLYTGLETDIVFSKANGNIRNLHYVRDESNAVNTVKVYSVETGGVGDEDYIGGVDLKDYKYYYPFDPDDTSTTAEQKKELQKQTWFRTWGQTSTMIIVDDNVRYRLPGGKVEKQGTGGDDGTKRLYSSQNVEYSVVHENAGPRCSPPYTTKAIQANTEGDKAPDFRVGIFKQWKSQAELEFLNSSADNSISGEVLNADGCQYDVDYGLGSVVTVVVQGFDKLQAYKCHITECNEVHSKNAMKVSVNFAYPKLQKKWKPPL